MCLNIVLLLDVYRTGKVSTNIYERANLEIFAADVALSFSASLILDVLQEVFLIDMVLEKRNIMCSMLELHVCFRSILNKQKRISSQNSCGSRSTG